jgi:membrane-bound metal-dependent hydrolase YbcI (DUF457 family)
MDPVTHAVVARMAASLGRSPIPRAGAVLSVAGGLAPDIDALFMAAGWDVYLRVHETGSHSAAGGAILAMALAAAWRPFSAQGFRPLAVTATTAVFSHILLDVLSGATIRLGWPLHGGRTAVGLVAMADPWLAVPVALALVIVFVTRWRIADVAPWTLTLLAAVLAGKAVSRQMAIQAYQAVADDEADGRYVHAKWGSPSGWWVYERTPARSRLWDVDARRGTVSAVLDLPGSAVKTAPGETTLSTVRNFLSAHDLPVRVAVHNGAGTTVFWSDLRFCFAPDERAGPAPGTSLRPTSDPIACGIWFGGELDASGRAVRQFVTIGDYVQRR